MKLALIKMNTERDLTNLKRMNKLEAYIFLIFSLVPLTLNAQFKAPFKIIPPVEDAWVDEQNPQNNYGDSKGHICAKNADDSDKEIYIKYNIENLPGNDSVVLAFHCGFLSYDCSDTGEKEFVVQLLPVVEEWEEHRIVWDNKPQTAEKALGEVQLTRDNKDYVFSSDKLTTYLNKAHKQGLNEVSFAIKGKSNVDGVNIWMHGKYWGFLNLECYYKQSEDITIEIEPGAGCHRQEEVVVNISASEESDIYYTLDGTMPGLHSPKYANPIKVQNNSEVTAIAFNGKKKSLYYQNFYAVNQPGSIVVNVNAAAETGIMQNFWNATGFSPAEILLQPDMRQACDYMGAIPNKGLVYVRPHYFLNLLAVEGINTNTPVYNWSRLDSAIDVLVNNGLKPIFQLMGNPSSNLNEFSAGFDENFQAQTESHETFFTNFIEREKLEAWKRLVKDVVVHFMERYGLHEVRSWYFESLNEPDYGSFWKFTEQEYLNYYDACSEALLEVDPQIRFGGPGTPGGLKSKYLKLLLAHCDTGTNYFTGKQGSRIDFISVHVKNDPKTMVELELEVIDHVKKNHPKFIILPFVNDEADPISGWRRDYWWRATPWHAAFIAQSVDLHYKKIIEAEKIQYAVLSNDNAFLGSWLHRTQFARFKDENNPSNFSLVKKPAFTVFTLLSLLGKTMLEANQQEPLPENIGIMPTIHKDGSVAIALYNKTGIEISNTKKSEKEDAILACGNENVTLQVSNLLNKEYFLIRYRIDENNANPYNIWKKMGEPSLPDDEQLRLLRQHQEISIEQMQKTIAIDKGEYKETISLPASSVCLVKLVPVDIKSPPPVVKGLRINRYNNISKGTDIMIRWDSPQQEYVLTYEVWYSEDNKDFRKVNSTKFIDNGYLLSLNDKKAKGYIKIRAVDYWKREGSFSETLYFE